VPANMGKPSLQQIVLQNFPFYQFVDVDLKEGGSEIDDSLDGLLITQPNKDYTEKELKRVNQFMMKGKSLVVVASAVNVKTSDAQMQATLSTHGLEKLLDGYGIELRKDAVLDFGRPFRVGVMTQGGLASMRFPQFLDVQVQLVPVGVADERVDHIPLLAHKLAHLLGRVQGFQLQEHGVVVVHQVLLLPLVTV
jgi:hypothetical protein